MSQQLLECSIDILGESVGVKIFKNEENYTFELSKYLQNKDQMGPYKPGSGAVDLDLDGLLRKLDIFQKSYTNIIGSEINPNY